MPRKQSDHEKTKGVWFTAVSHDEECRTSLKQHCKEFPFWGYIDHVPDKETEEDDKHFHTHLIIRTTGSRSIKQVCDILNIPSNYCQVVHQKRNLMRYFIHLDNPEKVQYKESDIHTNKIANFKLAFEDNSDDDVRRTFYDMNRLRSGEITINQFVDLHYMELQKMPFYQKIKTYELINKLACPSTT